MPFSSAAVRMSACGSPAARTVAPRPAPASSRSLQPDHFGPRGAGQRHADRVQQDELGAAVYRLRHVVPARARDELRELLDLFAHVQALFSWV